MQMKIHNRLLRLLLLALTGNVVTSYATLLDIYKIKTHEITENVYHYEVAQDVIDRIREDDPHKAMYVNDVKLVSASNRINIVMAEEKKEYTKIVNGREKVKYDMPLTEKQWKNRILEHINQLDKDSPIEMCLYTQHRYIETTDGSGGKWKYIEDSSDALKYGIRNVLEYVKQCLDEYKIQKQVPAIVYELDYSVLIYCDPHYLTNLLLRNAQCRKVCINITVYDHILYDQHNSEIRITRLDIHPTLHNRYVYIDGTMYTLVAIDTKRFPSILSTYIRQDDQNSTKPNNTAAKKDAADTPCARNSAYKLAEMQLLDIETGMVYKKHTGHRLECVSLVYATEKLLQLVNTQDETQDVEIEEMLIDCYKKDFEQPDTTYVARQQLVAMDVLSNRNILIHKLVLWNKYEDELHITLCTKNKDMPDSVGGFILIDTLLIIIEDGKRMKAMHVTGHQRVAIKTIEIECAVLPLCQNAPEFNGRLIPLICANFAGFPFIQTLDLQIRDIKEYWEYVKRNYKEVTVEKLAKEIAKLENVKYTKAYEKLVSHLDPSSKESTMTVTITRKQIDKISQRNKPWKMLEHIKVQESYRMAKEQQKMHRTSTRRETGQTVPGEQHRENAETTPNKVPFTPAVLSAPDTPIDLTDSASTDNLLTGTGSAKRSQSRKCAIQ